MAAATLASSAYSGSLSFLYISSTLRYRQAVQAVRGAGQGQGRETGVGPTAMSEGVTRMRRMRGPQEQQQGDVPLAGGRARGNRIVSQTGGLYCIAATGCCRPAICPSAGSGRVADWGPLGLCTRCHNQAAAHCNGTAPSHQHVADSRYARLVPGNYTIAGPPTTWATRPRGGRSGS